MAEEQNTKKRRTKGDIVSLVILIVLAVILIPIFAINLTLIIKGSTDPNTPPSVFGIAPMAVVSDSMDGDEPDGFAKGALIFVRILSDEEKQELKEGDIVTYRDGDAFVTHRVVTVNLDEKGEVATVTTKGDNPENGIDGAIPLENVLGVCTGSMGGMGSFAMFLQSPEGIVVVVGIPVLVYIAYDVTRITLYNRRAKAAAAAEAAAQENEKDEEIRRLRELLAEKGESAAEDAPAAEAAGTEAPPAAEDAPPPAAEEPSSPAPAEGAEEAKATEAEQKTEE